MPLDAPLMPASIRKMQLCLFLLEILFPGWWLLPDCQPVYVHPHWNRSGSPWDGQQQSYSKVTNDKDRSLLVRLKWPAAMFKAFNLWEVSDTIRLHTYCTIKTVNIALWKHKLKPIRKWNEEAISLTAFEATEWLPSNFLGYILKIPLIFD